jgi:hypothetical protein
MKTISQSSFAFTAVLLVVASTMYFLGSRGLLNLPSFSDNLNSGVVWGPASNRAVQASIEASKILTLAEARQRLLDLLAGHPLPAGTDAKWAFGHLVAKINPADIPALLDALKDLPGSKDKDMLLEMMLNKLWTKDPETALAQIGKLTDPELRKLTITNSLETLSNRNPQLAYAELMKLPAGEGQSAYAFIFAALAQANPAQAAADAASLPPGAARESALRNVGGTLAKTNPQAALEWAQGLPAGDSSVLTTVFAEVVRTDPQFAAANLAVLPDDASRNQAIVGIAVSQAVGPSKDPAAALTWLGQVATADTYNQAVAAIVSDLSRPQVVNSINANGNPVSTWSPYTQDLPTAVALLANITDPTVRATAITTLANNWSLTNVQDALTWAQTLPAPAATLNSIVSSWAKTDPNAALAFVQNSADPSAYLSSAPALAKAVAASDPQDALAFAENLPTGSMKTQSLNNVLATEAQTDFTDAWNSAVNLPPSKSQNVVMANLVGVEATQDPTQAAALLDQFSDPATQLTAAGNLSATWVKLDPQAFTVWLTGLPAGDVRDTAIAKLAASSQAQKNPAGVLQWVNTVSNPQIKATLLQKLAPAQTGGN